MDALISVFTAFTPFEWILCVILLLSFLVQLFFYLAVYRKPYVYEKKRMKSTIPANDLPGISVIITSKNNSEELKKICLLCWNRIIQIMK